MAQGRKYAALPDLDSAPDIYETQDAGPEDPNTHDGERSSSAASSYLDPDDAATAPDDAGVDKAQLQPGRARSRFGRARVDARAADFSDRVGGPKSSYRVTSRARRTEFGGIAGGDANGDGDADETFQEKLARLQREVEEVQALGEQQDSGATGAEKDMVNDLSQVLRDLEASRRSKEGGRPNGSMSNGDKASAATQQEDEQDEAKALQAIDELAQTTLPDASQTERALSLAATLEARLAALETTLGLPALALPQSTPASDSTQPRDKPVFVTLAALDRQMTALGSASGPSLGALATQIQGLTTDAETLAAARRAAATARKDLRAQAGSASGASRPLSSGSFSNSRPTSYARPGTGTDASIAGSAGTLDDGLAGPAAALLAGEESETGARLARLASALPTVHALAPLVPALLTRLGSLRALHERAADAGAALDAVERGQAQQSADLRDWRAAVRELETRIADARTGEEENKKVVRGWVDDLEKRMEDLLQDQ